MPDRVIRCSRNDDMPGIIRHKARHEFEYRHPDGEFWRDIETLSRIRSLAVSPAWTGVWICPIRGVDLGNPVTRQLSRWFLLLWNRSRRVDPAHPKPNYARGSVEWQEEQRRQSEAASG